MNTEITAAELLEELVQKHYIENKGEINHDY